MSKKDYRNFFAQCKSYFKLNTFCKKCDIKMPSLTQFVKGYDSALSESKLKQLYDCVIEFCQNIA